MKADRVPVKTVEASPCGRVARELSEELVRIRRLSSELEQCFVRGDSDTAWLPSPMAVLSFVEKARSARAGSPEGLAELEHWARTSATHVPAVFDRELRQLAEKSGVALEGQYPNYRFEGVLAVRIAEDGKTCDVDGEAIVGCFPLAVWAAVRMGVEQDRLLRIAPASLLGVIHRAYVRVVALSHSQVGDVAPIRRLFRELVIELQGDRFWRSPTREHWKPYSEKQFQRDLARLLQRGPFSTSDGDKLELTPTSFAKEGLPIFDGGGVRYIGGIAFSRAGG